MRHVQQRVGEMFRADRPPCGPWHRWVKAWFLRDPKAREKRFEFRAGGHVQSGQGPRPWIEAFRRAAIGEDDLMVLKDQMDIRHAPAALHNTNIAAPEAGKLPSADQRLVAMAFHKNGMLGRDDKPAIPVQGAGFDLNGFEVRMRRQIRLSQPARGDHRQRLKAVIIGGDPVADAKALHRPFSLICHNEGSGREAHNTGIVRGKAAALGPGKLGAVAALHAGIVVIVGPVLSVIGLVQDAVIVKVGAQFADVRVVLAKVDEVVVRRIAIIDRASISKVEIGDRIGPITDLKDKGIVSVTAGQNIVAGAAR